MYYTNSQNHFVIFGFSEATLKLIIFVHLLLHQQIISPNNKKYSYNISIICYTNKKEKNGSGALFGKILLVRIIKNNKIDAYLR